MKQTMINIKGYTEWGASAVLGLYIEICGLEKIQLEANIFSDGLIVLDKNTNNTGNFAKWDINYRDNQYAFSINSKACPIVGYEFWMDDALGNKVPYTLSTASFDPLTKDIIIDTSTPAD